MVEERPIPGDLAPEFTFVRRSDESYDRSGKWSAKNHARHDRRSANRYDRTFRQADGQRAPYEGQACPKGDSDPTSDLVSNREQESSRRDSNCRGDCTCDYEASDLGVHRGFTLAG